MNNLKIKSLKYFIICSLSMTLAESGITDLFSYFIYPLYDENDPKYLYMMILNITISFLIFFIGAYIFYRFTKKEIKAESIRRVQEQNLLYSSIAHDLKTPMTSIQGFAAALRDGKIKPEEQEEILDIIYKKSRHMNDLVETLLTYSKLGTESYSLNLSKTNLCTLVRDLAAMSYSEFEDKGIELNIEIPDEPIFCSLDEKEFSRAVSNLIINAYKHNSKGDNVLIKVHTENDHAVVTVADSGEKIPKKLAETMFNPFVSGDKSRTSSNGSGLGLAISSKIIEKHNGKLLYSEEVASGYAKGFVIRVRNL